MKDNYHTIIIGGGISGMATAANLQVEQKSTLVLEAHGQIGGCAGFFRKDGFAFDVGATTLVDFDENGIGANLLKKMNLELEYDQLPGYKAWLPDREVILYRNKEEWHKERLRTLGLEDKYIKFWNLVDNIATIFWEISRQGIKLPISSLSELLSVIKKLGLRNLHYSRYIYWTMEDALEKFGLQDDKPLRGLLGMLIEDTVHSSIENAPLINSCLGITIRGAGLSRAKGGMYGFWRNFKRRYEELGGKLKRGHKVTEIQKIENNMFQVKSNKGTYYAKNVVSAVPIQITNKIGSQKITKHLQPYIKRDRNDLGGAIVVFLGVPDEEVINEKMTHHQLMYDYDKKLGNGNNMFISVSSKGDLESAPEGYRAVMLSTHCELDEWEGLTEKEYQLKKLAIKNKLIVLARRVYPKLGVNAVVEEVGTPRTYEKFTQRPRGAVGGVRQKLSNSNLNAVPHWFDNTGFYQVGDTTWPGLGTVAGVLGAKIVSERIIKQEQSKKLLIGTVVFTGKTNALKS